MTNLIRAAIECGAGTVFGFLWASKRVAKIIEARLDTMKATGENPDFLAVCDDLFFALTPRPVARWIDRKGEREWRARRD